MGQLDSNSHRPPTRTRALDKGVTGAEGAAAGTGAWEAIWAVEGAAAATGCSGTICIVKQRLGSGFSHDRFKV
jgi:hypothetical protein